MEIKKVDDLIWEISKDFKPKMKVPIRVIASDSILNLMDKQVFDQAANVASLPGIQKYMYVMPDGHSGYGSPIGGVAAFDTKDGVISPGMIGFDISCGVRLILTNLEEKEVKSHIKEIIDGLFKAIPSGVGASGKDKIGDEKIKEILNYGANWAVDNDYGWDEDLDAIELNGYAKYADSSAVSKKAIDRGKNQLGTLGSGNHYLEIQVIRKENIFNEELAEKLGIFSNQVVILFHTGSRGLGHQIATDYLDKFNKIMKDKYNIEVSDRELAAVPFSSDDGQEYYKAMGSAVNFAIVNHQFITTKVREVFSRIFKKPPESLGMKVLFHVSHNRATLEKHDVDGEVKELLVHRKGATASYYPGREEIPKVYRKYGLPVLIGGSMETESYLLIGSDGSKETFCSTVHGAGRTMSRAEAKRNYDGKDIKERMIKKGIYIEASSLSGLAEEAGGAYKNVSDVVDIVDKLNISKKIVKMIPIGNIKG